MANIFAPARGQSALYSRPWMGQVGTYPGAQPGNMLDQLMPPAPPQSFAPPPQLPPPPIYAGSVPSGVDNFADANSAGYAGEMPGHSPNQTAAGVLGALGTAIGFGISPVGTLAGIFAGMLNDTIAGRAIGGTTSFTDIGLRAANLPSVGEILGNVLGGSTTGAWGDNQGSMFGDFGVDPDTGVIGSGPFAGGIDMTSPENAAALAGVMGGGYGPGPSAADFGDMSPNAFGGSTSMSDFGGGIGNQGGNAGAGGTADGSTGWMTGGYTGAGADGMVQPTMPAGTVHEGEGVINAAAMQRYGDAAHELIAALNAGAVKRNRLLALLK